MISEIKSDLGLPQNLALQTIRGKVVVVAGGADGLGLATAQFLARHGAQVVITARTPEALKAALQETPELSGFVMNSSQPEQIQNIFRSVQNLHGSIDILIHHTAGMVNQIQLDAETCRNQWMQEAIECMQTHKGGTHKIGHIVNINNQRSQAKKGPDWARIQGMAAALRRQAAELGIRVTSIEADEQELAFEEVAQCVYESLIQPFRMDVIYLRAQVQ